MGSRAPGSGPLTQSVGFLPAGIQTPSAHRWALRGVFALLVVAIGASIAVGAGRPSAPSLLPAAAGAGLEGHSAPVSRVAGFGQIGFRVITPGSTRTPPLRCALLADTPKAIAAGMRGRTGLAGYDAMILRFFHPSSAALSEQGAPIALSVAWFDTVGVYIGTARLATCVGACPAVRAPLPYALALEVPAGGLHRLGVGSGSVLLVGGNCGS